MMMQRMIVVLTENVTLHKPHQRAGHGRDLPLITFTLPTFRLAECNAHTLMMTVRSAHGFLKMQTSIACRSRREPEISLHA